MTPDRKYQVFISSTYEDLKQERDAVVKACLEAGHIPIGMEMFSAADSSQWEVIQRTIDKCDYYAVIVAERYGHVIPAEGGISYTEKEYDYAVQKDVPVLGFVLVQGASWPTDRRETDVEKQKRLVVFKDKVKSRMVSFWESQADLPGKFGMALLKAALTDPRPGWIPATMAAGPEVLDEMARLSRENEDLRKRAASQNGFDAQSAVVDLQNHKMSFNGPGGQPVTLLMMFQYFMSVLREGVARDNFFLYTDPIRKFAGIDDETIATETINGFDAHGLVEVETVVEDVSTGFRGSSASRRAYWRLSPEGRDLCRFLRKHQMTNPWATAPVGSGNAKT